MFSICVRRIRNGRFDDEPVIGPTRYLDVPDGQVPAPRHEIPRGEWVRRVIATFNRGPGGRMAGDLTLYVHGFNNSVATVARRHLKLRNGLLASGFSTTVISYDWPSGTEVLGYLEDRHDAKQTAMRLVTDGIRLFLAARTRDCEVNVHVVAHSMGALVVREAFDDADDTRLPDGGWTANQVVFVAGDVSRGSLAVTNVRSDGLYRHSYRLTNYFSGHDVALQVSNAKRVGLAPRAGRVGLPDNAPAKAVDVDCGPRYLVLSGGAPVAADGEPSHTFYFDDDLWMRDLASTLLGRVDREVLSTRGRPAGGGPPSLYVLRPDG